MINNNAVYVASEVVSGDPGLVTASLLHDYMENFKQSLATSPIDWDVPSLNIKCNGKNILKTDYDGESINLGHNSSSFYLDANVMQINANSQITLYGGYEVKADAASVRLSASQELELYGSSSAKITAGTNIKLYSIGLTHNDNTIGNAEPGVIDWDLESLNIRCKGQNIISSSGYNLVLGDRNSYAYIQFSGGTEITVYGGGLSLGGHEINMSASRIAMHADVISPGGIGENPTSIDWNLDSLNIKCGGRNVISAVGSDIITFGNVGVGTTVKGSNMNIETPSTIKLKGDKINAEAGYTIDLISVGALAIKSPNTGIELYGDVRLMTPKQYNPADVVRNLGLTDPESDKEIVYF